MHAIVHVWAPLQLNEYALCAHMPEPLYVCVCVFPESACVLVCGGVTVFPHSAVYGRE